MPNTPVITEAPLKVSGYTDKDGFHTRRAFDIVAASEVDAINILAASKYAITYGSVLRNAWGEKPDPLATCTRIDHEAVTPTPPGGQGLWRLICTFEHENVNQSATPQVGGSAVYEWSRAEQTQTFEKDLDGNVIVNSANEPYAEFPTVPIPHRLLTVSWYDTSSSVNLTSLFGYDATYNSEIWTIRGKWRVAVGQALIHGVDVVDEQSGATQLRLTAEFRPGGLLWHPYQMLDYTIVNGVRKLLDGEGNITDTPHYLEYRLFEGRDPNGIIP